MSFHALSHQLPGFRGDAGWVHDREDRPWIDGAPYWPGGDSGVTLRPGVDLGYADRSLVERNYKLQAPAKGWAAIESAFGLKGRAAKNCLARDTRFQLIDISYEEGKDLFPVVARPYWDGIVREFPDLLREDVPGEVHTVFLSLSFNRGWANPALDALRDALRRYDFSRLANLIGAMQQSHRLRGIRKRRRLEADKLRDMHVLATRAVGISKVNPLPPDSLIRPASAVIQ